MKKGLSIVVLALSIIVVCTNSAFALDEWCNKLKAQQTVKVDQINKDVELTYSFEQVYDLDADEMSEYKYAFEVGTGLTEHTELAIEYKYIDKQKKVDAEEVEVNFAFFFDLPFDIGFKDSNKIVTNIRNGDNEYANEVELSRELFKVADKHAVSFLLKDEILHDFQDDKWKKNNVGTGLEVDIAGWGIFEIVYWHVDVVDASDNTCELETQFKVKF